jgi:hypothetical protein
VKYSGFTEVFSVTQATFSSMSFLASFMELVP